MLAIVGVAVGVGEYEEQAAKEIKICKIEIAKLQARVGELEVENEALKKKASLTGSSA